MFRRKVGWPEFVWLPDCNPFYRLNGVPRQGFSRKKLSAEWDQVHPVYAMRWFIRAFLGSLWLWALCGQ